MTLAAHASDAATFQPQSVPGETTRAWKDLPRRTSREVQQALDSTAVAQVLAQNARQKMDRSFYRWLSANYPAFMLQIDWRIELHHIEKRMAGKNTFRDDAYRFLASPASTKGGTVLSVFLSLLSFAYLIVDGTQSSVEPTATRGDSEIAESGFLIANIAFSSVFTLELLARLAVYRQPLCHGFLWLDALTLAPLYVRLGCGAAGVTEMQLPEAPRMLVLLLEALISLRLLKHANLFLGMHVVRRSLFGSLAGLVIPCILLVIILTFFGGLVFAAEFAAGADNLNFLPTAWWMMIVTMTTVGYGDYSPLTTSGRLLTGMAIICGICFVSMPIAIVGKTFSEEWDRCSLELIVEAQQQLYASSMCSGLSAESQSSYLLEVFRLLDADGSGVIDYREFIRALKRLGVHLAPQRTRQAWKKLDADESGAIDFVEFLAIFPDAQVECALASIMQATGELPPVPDSDGETSDASSLRALLDEVCADVRKELAHRLLEQLRSESAVPPEPSKAKGGEASGGSSSVLVAKLEAIEAAMRGYTERSLEEHMRQSEVRQAALDEKLTRVLATQEELFARTAHGAMVATVAARESYEQNS